MDYSKSKLFKVIGTKRSIWIEKRKIVDINGNILQLIIVSDITMIKKFEKDF